MLPRNRAKGKRSQEDRKDKGAATGHAPKNKRPVYTGGRVSIGQRGFTFTPKSAVCPAFKRCMPA